MNAWEQILVGQLVSFALHQLAYRLLHRKTVTKLRPMEIYSQRDPRWASLPLGESHYTVGSDGCTATCVAQALTIAGWNVTPGDLVTRLNENHGFTDKHYLESHPGAGDGKPGLILWYKVQELYPQFHFGSGGYTFQPGVWGKTVHWCLQYADAEAGHTIDPWYGRMYAPTDWNPCTGYRTASIDAAPVEVSVDFQVRPTALINARITPQVLPSTEGLPHNVAMKVAKGTVIDCVDTVIGPDGDKWYVSKEHGYYLSATYCEHL